MPSNDSSVKEALDKKAAYGADVDIDHYDEGEREPEFIEDLQSSDYARYMEQVGVVADEMARSGTLTFIDNGMSHRSHHVQEGLELMSTSEAMKLHDGLKDYFWTIMDPTKDKYTAKSYLENSDGYFIRVKSGYHIKYPVQTCMMRESNKSIQNLHNIVIVEDNASLELITGCTTVHKANDALHVGVSEMFVGDNANLTFSMIHNWSDATAVRPRTNCVIGKNSNYTNNYVMMNPVGTLQSYPVAHVGENSSATYNTMCVATKGSSIDTGGMSILEGKNARSEIMSRSISNGGRMVARGKLVGKAPGAKGHLECRSIILDDEGSATAIPELDAQLADVEMTHEAAVGKIARDQIEYIMSRGLTEDQAVSMIVRGFLSGNITGLPKELQDELEKAVNTANLGN